MNPLFSRDFVDFRWPAMTSHTEMDSLSEEQRCWSCLYAVATIDIHAKHATICGFQHSKRPNGHSCAVLFRWRWIKMCIYRYRRIRGQTNRTRIKSP